MSPPNSALTGPDSRAIDKLRRQVALWPKYRWAFLSVALLWIGTGIYVELSALRTLREIALSISPSPSGVERGLNGSAMFLSCLATKNAVFGELLRWSGVAVLIGVLARWRGNPIYRIVLALIPPGTGAPSGTHGPA